MPNGSRGTPCAQLLSRVSMVIVPTATPTRNDTTTAVIKRCSVGTWPRLGAGCASSPVRGAARRSRGARWAGAAQCTASAMRAAGGTLGARSCRGARRGFQSRAAADRSCCALRRSIPFAKMIRWRWRCSARKSSTTRRYKPSPACGYTISRYHDITRATASNRLAVPTSTPRLFLPRTRRRPARIPRAEPCSRPPR